ncbi:hypothetical protein GCM10025751_22370 [Haladaptatus pallidirubidus]|uniref:Uncharacterized protein n=1 Tax=Haladaptatus pallidirubidus TaxID=1008152 RepID=A0AAV3UGH5_9EURY
MHFSHLADALVRHNSITQHLIPAPASIAGANKITLQEAQIHIGFVLLFREIATPGSHTGPTRKTTESITVTVCWLVTVAVFYMGFSFLLDLCPTVCDEGMVCCCLQEWGSNCDANPMFACSFVPSICRTFTGDGDPVANGDEIFMIGRIRVTRIPNEDTPRCE